MKKIALAVQQDLPTLEVLLSLGYEVLEAGDCIAGLRKCIRFAPDLLVTTLKMPGFNGIAMAEMLELFAIPTRIIFTSNSSKDKKRLHDFKTRKGFVLETEIPTRLALAVEEANQQPLPQAGRFHYLLRQHEWSDLAACDNRKRILLVEDSPWLKKACMMTLDQLDSYALFGATNGLEGLVKALLIRPDLILTDLHMPVLDGLALAEMLYLLNQPFPLVFLTGDENHDFSGEVDRIGGVLGVVLKKELREQSVFLQKIDQYLHYSELQQKKMREEFTQGSSHLLLATEKKLFLEGKGLCTPGASFAPASHHIEALQKNGAGMGAFFTRPRPAE